MSKGNPYRPRPRRSSKIANLGPECHYCGNYADTDDHIIPKALGGTDRKENIVPSCQSCNAYKAASMPTCTCTWCSRAILIWRVRQSKRKVRSHASGN